MAYKELYKSTNNRFYFLLAGTGAGKSSLFINELLKNTNGLKILCTKPKVQLVKDSMIDLPKNYSSLIPGINMGYKVGGGDEVKAVAPVSITFMTT